MVHLPPNKTILEKQNYHMSPEQFRKEGKKVIDWIADYYENIEKYPVLSQVNPGDIKKSLPRSEEQIGRAHV